MTDSQKAQNATRSVEKVLTDSQKAAQEIHDSINGFDGYGCGPWTMLREDGTVMDEEARESIVERIRQIIDRHLC